MVLRREVCTTAAGAGSEQEFFARLRAAGVLVRERYSTVKPDQVTGYAVGLPGHTVRGGGVVWYGGGKLAAQASIPKLRVRWLGTSPGAKQRTRPSIRLTAADQRAIWDGAACAAARAARTIRLCALTDPAAAADAAWATSDTLHVAANIVESRTLRKAADSCRRAARHGYGRILGPPRPGTRLRASARLLALSAAESTGTRPR